MNKKDSVLCCVCQVIFDADKIGKHYIEIHKENADKIITHLIK